MTSTAPPSSQPPPPPQSSPDARRASSNRLYPHHSLIQRALYQDESQPRLSIPRRKRIVYIATGGFGVGSALGYAYGMRTARLRFRAEHAHRMPTTTAAWYFYHKARNVYMARAGVREGLRMGARIAFWSTMATLLEAELDHWRAEGSKDMWNTMSACVTVSALFGLWNRLPVHTVRRTASYGLMFGVVYGGLQDVIGVMSGRRINYVEYLKKQFRLSSGSTAQTNLPPDPTTDKRSGS